MSAGAAVDYFAVDGHETEQLLEFWTGQGELDDLDAAMFMVWCEGAAFWRRLTHAMAPEVREAAANAVFRHEQWLLIDHPNRAPIDAQALRWWR